MRHGARERFTAPRRLILRADDADYDGWFTRPLSLSQPDRVCKMPGIMRSIALVLTLALFSTQSLRVARAEEPPPPAATPTTPAEPAPAPAQPAPAPPPDTTTQPAPAATEAPKPDAKPEAKPAGLVDDGPVSKMRLGAWVGVACTVAVLTAGAIFGLAAQSRADEVSRRLVFVDANNLPRKYDESARKDDENLRKEGKLYNGLAIGFYSAAGALAIMTTVLFAVDATRKSKSKHARVLPVPLFTQGGAGLSLGGTF